MSFARITALRDKKASLLILAIGLSASYMPLFGENIAQVSEKHPAVAMVTPSPRLDDGWRVANGGYVTVYYDAQADLASIEHRLKKRGAFASWGRDLAPTLTQEERLVYRLDLLFERVMGMLDMYPPGISVKVKIFKGRAALAKEYQKIFGTSTDERAFYIHRHRTIYTSEEDISDYLIAHEMGHVVIDHYFPSLPPGKVAEILASYVDVHLEEF